MLVHLLVIQKNPTPTPRGYTVRLFPDAGHPLPDPEPTGTHLTAPASPRETADRPRPRGGRHQPGRGPGYRSSPTSIPTTPPELHQNATTTANLPRRPLSQVPGAPGPQPGPRGPGPAVPELRGRNLPGCPRATAPQRGSRETPPAPPPAGVSRTGAGMTGHRVNVRNH